MIEQRADLLQALYGVLNIQRRPFLQPGVDYLRQREEYAHVVTQAEQAEIAVRRAEAYTTAERWSSNVIQIGGYTLRKKKLKVPGVSVTKPGR